MRNPSDPTRDHSGPPAALTFTVEIPSSVPWSLSGDSLFIQPFLFNGDASTWYYYDNIKYTNVTGTPSNPLTFQLTFNADQVTGNVVETASTTIYQVDLVTITFTLQSGTTWKQVWSVTPGAIGTAAGATATFGTSSFTFASGALFNYIWLQALFTGTFWDFGNLSWSNIRITASTTDTSWCTPYPIAVASPGPGYNATFAGGQSVAAVVGTSSTCTLAEMTWLQPPAALVAEAAFQAELAECAILQSEGERCHY
ncbi:hypothetical protein V8E51_007241 [Hyaloscypha variabilis]